ncbi:hypothetical protein GLX27_001214 [Malassezia furfur]|uniref:Tetratricopeptide SHNi-TPR domain-containing protein n=1 Tax=Malassezia furfur TaxID=55194 RepID=A0ABY8EP07_MALFU|nr:hypothetical protein GLX27_001214 [Malassezia furfur]
MSKPSKDSAADQVKVQLDEANRCFALKKYDGAADLLASALEELRDAYDEDAPELAPILHLYGRALLEHFIKVGGALGTGGAVEAPSVNDPLPPAEKDDSGANDDAPSKATGKRKATDDADQAQEEEEEEEDDLAVAFTVLDLSRVIFERILGTSASQPASSKDAASRTKHDVQLVTLTGDKLDERDLVIELGEVYNDLGDVGLESENFEQASEDYASSLRVLAPLLVPFSRRLSDAHLRLGLALEFHPNNERRGEAISHIEQALHVLQRRLVELEKEEVPALEGKLVSERDNLAAMDSDQRQREIRDVKEVLKDVELKVRAY